MGIWGDSMLTLLMFMFYCMKQKVLEHRIIFGERETNTANIFFMTNGTAKRQLTGNLMTKYITDKCLFIGAIILDVCLISVLVTIFAI